MPLTHYQVTCTKCDFNRMMYLGFTTIYVGSKQRDPGFLKLGWCHNCESAMHHGVFYDPATKTGQLKCLGCGGSNLQEIPHIAIHEPGTPYFSTFKPLVPHQCGGEIVIREIGEPVWSGDYYIVYGEQGNVLRDDRDNLGKDTIIDLGRTGKPSSDELAELYGIDDMDGQPELLTTTRHRDRDWEKDPYCRISLGEKELAKYKQAIEQGSEEITPWIEVVKQLIELGREGEANLYALRAVQLFPESADTWCELAISFLDLAQYKRAWAACFRALQLKPKHDRTRVVIDLLNDDFNSHSRPVRKSDLPHDENEKKMQVLDPEAAEFFSELDVDILEKEWIKMVVLK